MRSLGRLDKRRRLGKYGKACHVNCCLPDWKAVVKLKLKPGDTVRVIGSRGTAKIRAILTSIHGALLEKQIDGFRRWNLDELRLVK
jgi:predicted RNA-binding protein YlqC (UPF0109 family)